MPKLLAYNTSFVNDAHNTQYFGRSTESASLIKKALKYYKDDFTEEKLEDKLQDMRNELTDSINNYLKNNLSTTDFMALIEQILHIPSENNAYYKFGDTETDLENNNMNYGILKRMITMGINFNEKNSNYHTNETHFCIFDSAIALDENGGSRGFGEGIAIVAKNIPDDFSFLEWEDPIIKTTKKSKVVDIGPLVCKEGDKMIWQNNKAIDSGRPLMICIAKNGTKFKIYIAFHGPNIYNLNKIGHDKKVKNYEPEERKNIAKEVSERIIFVIETQINIAIGEEIIPTSIELFMGGDANDPGGYLLESLLTRGINIKEKNVKFNYTNKTSTTNNEGRYTDLYSCCANADSLTKDLRNPDENEASGDIIKKRLDHINSKSEEKIGYGADFINPSNFGYNGDYALYGTFGIDNLQTNTMYLEKNPPTIGEDDKKIHSSDHLPVLSNITNNPEPKTEGGKRRTRRRRRRSTRRKRRMSRRRRRSTRRKR